MSKGQSLTLRLDITEASNDNEEPTAPQTPAVRLTRRQLAKLEEEEALGKSQRAPSPQPEEDVVQETSKQPVEPVADEAVVDAKEKPPLEKNAIPMVHDEPTKAELAPAKKPTRRTRRQQTNTEEQDVVEDTAKEPMEHESEDIAVAAENDDVAQDMETTVAPQGPAPAEAEPTLKPKRLTRRQQAKLEEEQKQSHAEQQAPQPEPTEEEVLEEVVAEAQAEATIEREEGTSKETANDEANGKAKGVTDDGSPVAIADERSILQEAASLPSQADDTVETEAPAGNQVVDLEEPEVATVEEVPAETMDARPATPTEAEFEADFVVQPEEIVPSTKTSIEAEPKMLSAEKPFDESVSTPMKNQESSRRTSRSPSKSPMRIEESISAIDRLEEDLESIGKAIPDFDHSDDEKAPRKPVSTETTATPITRAKILNKTLAKTPARTPAQSSAKVASKTPSKTSAKAPVPTRASAAAKAPAVAKASLPSRISRVPSAAPKSVKPSTTSLARASSIRTAPSKDIRKPSTETADYLASKRRPISLSFPTPPPPPKGRAPTKPTFQLSSDNVAAKLKAQKEERLKREAEGGAAPKQRPISMPPPPRSTKPPTVPTFQLSSEATAAKLKAQKEERLKRMEEAGGDKPSTRPISMPPPPKSTKQLTKPSFQLPGEATAARLKAQKEERLKRMEEAEAAKKAALAAPVRKPIAHRPRQSLLVKDAPGVSIPPPPQVEASQRSTSLASKRSSVIEPSASRSTSTSSANRNSLLLAEGKKSTVTPVDAAALKSKGKQVFNRDKMEKEAMERERREKEEAAKKARAEAAERGRIASREWAERQRKKMMGQQM
jgi:hypothetical protein